jgi:ABC-type nickel/cobalt efflux system permease component RcnA
MEIPVLYGTALLLGSLHALEPDHMAAVTTFTVRRPRGGSSVGFGLRWALGHGGAILIVGTLIIAAGLRFPDAAGHFLERAVGVVLIGLGLWTLVGSRRLHAHRHEHGDGTVHAHLHSHAVAEHHDHGHGATAIGLLHGLAGTAPAVALVPLATFDTPALAIGYLAIFGVGTALGMALYALVAGLIVGRAAFASERLARGLAAFTGAATIAIGLVWVLR